METRGERAEQNTAEYNSKTTTAAGATTTTTQKEREKEDICSATTTHTYTIKDRLRVRSSALREVGEFVKIIIVEFKKHTARGREVIYRYLDG